MELFAFRTGFNKYENTEMECIYEVRKDIIVLSHLEVFPDERGRGVGTSFMKSFIEHADPKKDIYLFLDYDEPIRFYKRFGFVAGSGRSMVLKRGE